MNLVTRCSERTPDDLHAFASESPGKTKHESQFPLSSWNEQHQRTGRPVKDTYLPSFSEWNVDKTWSSQEWKSDELMEDGRLVVTAQHTERFIVENDKMNSYTESRIRNVVRIQIILAQGERSSAKEEEPILKRCNERQRQTFFNMENVYVFDITSICFHGKRILRKFTFDQQLRSIKNTGNNLTMK